MVLPRALYAIIFAASFVSPACHRHHRVGSDLDDIKAESGQTALALSAVGRLREAFNSSACQASNEAGAKFASQSAADSEYECEHLRKDLGPWLNFRFEFTERCAAPEVVVCVVGVAEFEKQSGEVSAWLLRNNGAQLVWLALKQDEWHWMQIPPRTRGKSIDPPPLKLTKDSLAS